MQNKKLAILVFIILPIIALIIIGFSIKLNNQQHTMAGVVEEVYNDSSILITQLDKEGKAIEGDLYVVSINKERNDSKKDFKVGEEIVVYYNGMIAESYPAQIHNVFKITTKAI